MAMLVITRWYVLVISPSDPLMSPIRPLQVQPLLLCSADDEFYKRRVVSQWFPWSFGWDTSRFHADEIVMDMRHVYPSEFQHAA